MGLSSRKHFSTFRSKICSSIRGIKDDTMSPEAPEIVSHVLVTLEIGSYFARTFLVKHTLLVLILFVLNCCVVIFVSLGRFCFVTLLC